MWKTTLKADKVVEFLHRCTPESWVSQASDHRDKLLIDHANCERKAASSALSMIYRYAEKPDFALRLSRIVREEMRHFEQVMQLLKHLKIEYRPISPSRYAKGLHQFAKNTKPSVIDDLLIASIIEARSYERFALLENVMEGRVGDLFGKLKESEHRHFLTYIDMAKQVEAEVEVQRRVQVLLQFEASLISDYDPKFRFHSGDPGERHQT